MVSAPDTKLTMKNKGEIRLSNDLLEEGVQRRWQGKTECSHYWYKATSTLNRSYVLHCATECRLGCRELSRFPSFWSQTNRPFEIKNLSLKPHFFLLPSGVLLEIVLRRRKLCAWDSREVGSVAAWIPASSRNWSSFRSRWRNINNSIRSF